MACVLPGWIAWLSTLIVIGGSLLGAGAVFLALDRAGAIFYPLMTMEDHGKRSLWSATGVLLGVFLGFPITAAVLAAVVRPALCDSFGIFL
jgi:Na+/phosphate symporter